MKAMTCSDIFRIKEMKKNSLIPLLDEPFEVGMGTRGEPVGVIEGLLIVVCMEAHDVVLVQPAVVAMTIVVGTQALLGME